MKINENVPFLIRDVFLHDIVSCHYTIMDSLGFDMTGIPVNDKFERNKQIGLMMRSNPRLVQILRKITISTIDEYILRNKIKENELILRQYDGFITTKKLNEIDKYIPIPLRHHFIHFLSSLDRTSYIAYDGNKVKIKGVSYRYEKIDQYLIRLGKCNFADRIETFKELQRIKNEIVFSTDPMLFCIPSGNKNYIFLKAYGQVEISKTLAKVMDVNDIDRQKYFDFYISPFTKSIVFEIIK